MFAAKGVRLELLANGRYRMRSRESGNEADIDSEGTWTTHQGQDVELRSDNPSQTLQVLLVWSPDSLESHDGKLTLHRERAEP